ncbi:MAG: hypothetical protein ACFFCH_08425 [Promethearchaeota archaeon]
MDVVDYGTQPVFGEIINQNPLLVEFSFPTPSIQLDQALSIAQSLLTPHLPPSVSLDLEDSALLPFVPDMHPIPPRWALDFNGCSVTVDAVTGVVLDYVNSYVVSVPDNDSSIISEDEALLSAIAFMSAHNILIPPNARFVGTRSYHPIQPEYWIRFTHYEGPINIFLEEINIGVDLISGQVFHYHRWWTGIPPLIIEGVAENETVMIFLMDWLIHSSPFNINDTVIGEPSLMLTRGPGCVSSEPDTTVLRLFWVTRLRDADLGFLLSEVLSDAFTGEVEGRVDYRGGESFTFVIPSSESALNVVIERRVIIGIIGLSISVIIASSLYYVFRRRYRE